MPELNEFNQILGRGVPGWAPVQKPSTAVMQGRYCTLEILSPERHGDQLFQQLGKGESWTYLPYGPFASGDDFKAWLGEKQAEKDTLLYAILDANTRQAVGIAGYLRINPEHGVIEVGHLHYSGLLQRTPMSTEAMYLMMRHVFDELHYRRYEWKCNSLNEDSKRAALRLGFRFEGIFRQSNVFKDRNRDTAWFSIIDSEWPEIKEKFQRWLDPANFDANGRQIKSLREI